MDTPKVFESEYRFCLILWEHEPVASGELVRLCRERLGWKPTTTYTVIKRLSERGVLKNEHAVVTSLVTPRLPRRLCPAPPAHPGGAGPGPGDDRPVQKGGGRCVSCFSTR